MMYCALAWIHNLNLSDLQTKVEPSVPVNPRK